MSESSAVNLNITAKQATLAAATAAVILAGVGGYLYLNSGNTTNTTNTKKQTKKKKPTEKSKSTSATETTSSGETPKPLTPEEQEGQKKAGEIKELGNKYFKEGKYVEAVQAYTQAISLSNVDVHLLYSNRSAAYLSLKQYEHAMDDAKKCVELRPDWSKGYWRLGKTLLEINQVQDAFIQFTKGLKVEPSSADLKKFLGQARERLQPFGKRAYRFQQQIHLLNKFIDALCSDLLKQVGLTLEQLKESLSNAVQAKQVASIFEIDQDLRSAKEKDPVAVLQVVALLLLHIYEDADVATTFAADALYQSPEDPQVMIVNALALIRQNKYIFKSWDEAVRIFDLIRKSMLQRPSDSFTTHTYMGFLATIVQSMGAPDCPISLTDTLGDLQICLSNSTADKLQVAHTGIQIWFRQFDDPAIHARLEQEEKTLGNMPPNQAYLRGLLSGTFKDLCMNPFFLQAMSEVVIPFPQLEKILSPFRSALLEVKPGSSDFAAASPFIYALALQCMKTNYIWETKREELKEVDAIIKKAEQIIETNQAVKNGNINSTLHHHLALIAMFKPLGVLKNAHELVLQLNLQSLPDPFVVILNKSILSPAEEKIDIEQFKLTEIPDTDIARYYETHIVPEWDSLATTLIMKVHFIEDLKWRFPSYEPVGFDNKTPVKLLIAACGSGKEVQQAYGTFSDVDVTAFDISTKNLAYAIRQNADLGITDAKFHLADALALTPSHFPSLFDAIWANDFFHYLTDPVKPWSTLANLLRPGGIMTVTLHNRRVLSTIKKVRADLAPHFSPAIFDNSDIPKLIRIPTDDEVREARKILLVGLETEQPSQELSELVSTLSFYTLNEFRDLVFHPQLIAFTFGSVAELVKRAGLEVVGFEFPEIMNEKELTYLALYPDDPDMKNVKYLDEFDEKDSGGGGGVFSGLYISVTCQKPITKEGRGKFVNFM